MLYWVYTPKARGKPATSPHPQQRDRARARRGTISRAANGGRAHFDKVIFNLPIPRFDAKIKLHRDLADAAAKAERVAAAVALPEGVKFQRARSLVRTALKEAGLADAIDALVAKLLNGA